MGSRLSAPGPQQRRFAGYMEGLANAAGHTDRQAPLKNYCMGLLLPGERKSVEPMAARLAPNDVRRRHQSLHHLVADAPWKDQEMLAEVQRQVLPGMLKHGPVVAWIVDDTGFPKSGKHSVGVARQYCAKAKMWSDWQTGQLSGGGELIHEYLACEFTHCLAAVFARGVGQ